MVEAVKRPRVRVSLAQMRYARRLRFDLIRLHVRIVSGFTRVKPPRPGTWPKGIRLSSPVIPVIEKFEYRISKFETITNFEFQNI